jgi:hypothetical protein
LYSLSASREEVASSSIKICEEEGREGGEEAREGGRGGIRVK